MAASWAFFLILDHSRLFLSSGSAWPCCVFCPEHSDPTCCRSQVPLAVQVLAEMSLPQRAFPCGQLHPFLVSHCLSQALFYFLCVTTTCSSSTHLFVHLFILCSPICRQNVSFWRGGISVCLAAPVTACSYILHTVGTQEIFCK